MGEEKFHHQDLLTAAAIGLMLFACYLYTSALRFRSIDEVAVFAVTRSIVGHQGVDTDILLWVGQVMGRGTVVTPTPGMDGHYHTVKDVSTSLVGVPLVWLAHQVDISPVRTMMVSSLSITALTGSLVYLTGQRWGYRRRTALIAALTFGVGSMAWPYAETLFTQPMAAFGLALATFGVTGRSPRWMVVAGVGCGIAGLSATPTWIVAPAFLLYILHRERRWQPGAIFCAGVGVGMLVLFWYNAIRFGSPFVTGYQAGGISQQISPQTMGAGLIGLLVSTASGVVWFAPFTALIPISVSTSWRDSRQWLLIGQFLLLLGVYSAFDVWWGGLVWGPRFLVTVMPAMTLLLLPLFKRLHRWQWVPVGAILALSVLTQAGAAALHTLDAQSHAVDAGMYTPTHLLDISDHLIQPEWLPQYRLINTAQIRDIDTIWWQNGIVDRGVWAAQTLLVMSGVFCLALTQRVRWGIALQASLSVLIVGMTLARYPTISMEYSPDQSNIGDVHGMADALTTKVNPQDEAVVTVLPYTYLSWLNSYQEYTPDFGLLSGAAQEDHFYQAVDEYQRVWMVARADIDRQPRNGVESWLAAHRFAGPVEWVGNYRLVPYTLPSNDLTLMGGPYDFGPIQLNGFALEQTPDKWLNLWLHWEALETLPATYTVFIHISETPDGHPVQQRDSWPAGGTQPTSQWEPGSVINDGHAIYLGYALEPGTYYVKVGLANDETGGILTLPDGSEHVLLTSFDYEW